MQTEDVERILREHRLRLPPALTPAIRDLALLPAWFQLVTRGWSLERILDADLQYRCFLQLIADSPDEPHVPSADADLLWHEHILATATYVEDCHAVFGRYLHHYPFSGRFGADDLRLQEHRFQNSQQRIAEMTTRDHQSTDNGDRS